MQNGYLFLLTNVCKSEAGRTLNVNTPYATVSLKTFEKEYTKSVQTRNY